MRTIGISVVVLDSWHTASPEFS